MADAGPGPSRNPLHRAPIVNPPFDINTIRTSAPRHPAPRTTSRLFGLREAPTYYPTPEQFADPLAYVASLPAEARAAGICKVVPPEGWKMPFCVESDTFRFKTRLQRLNQLEAASRAKVNFLEQLTMFHMQQGDATVTIPVIDRRPLDVWRLRKEVTKMGGYDNVTAIKGWERITELMGYAVGWAPEFKSAYARIVLPFEKYSARAKSQSASPLTPLSTKKSETQRPPGWAMTAPGSPTAANGKPGRMGAVKMASGKAKGSRMSGISTRPRRGGSPPPPTSVSLPEVKSLDFASTSGSRSATPQPATAGPRLRIPGFSDREGTDSDLSDDSLSPPPPPAKKLPEEPYQKGEVCEVCRRGNEGDKILLCDGCDRGEL
jgi:histone demethylase JARID1